MFNYPYVDALGAELDYADAMVEMEDGEDTKAMYPLYVQAATDHVLSRIAKRVVKREEVPVNLDDLPF